MQLETARLQIRPFALDDAPAIHRILDLTFGDGTRVEDGDALRERQSWVQWNVLNQQWHARLAQPPYGDLAGVSKRTQTVIGAVGYVPCLDRFEQLPGLRGAGGPASTRVPPGPAANFSGSADGMAVRTCSESPRGDCEPVA